MKPSLTVAAVNWALQPSITDDGFYDHLRAVLDRAAGCDLIVLPEQFSLELLGATGQMNPIEEPRWLAGHFDRILDRLCEHAKDLNATIVGGSHFWEREAPSSQPGPRGSASQGKGMEGTFFESENPHPLPPLPEKGEGIFNVCPVIQPDGSYELQTKNKLTTYEREVWKIRPDGGA